MPSAGLAKEIVSIYVSLIWTRGKRNVEKGLVLHSPALVRLIHQKYIKMNLGKHVALYHLELAQLWRCPLSWCTVWKGTAQDCIDHMRRAHDIPSLVKAANLARWFPPWTVTREQWHSMSRPAISGIAIDTLLFSRIGVLLFHRYRVFNRQGTHGAFCGSYMPRMHTFLEELDAASLRRRHRRCAKDSLRFRQSWLRECLLELCSGPPIGIGWRMLLEKGLLTQSLLQWKRKIALWSRRACRVIHRG